MKVLLLIDSLGSGGAQRQLCLLACGLRQRGIKAEVMTYHPEYTHFQGMLTAAGVPVSHVGKGSRFSVTTPLRIIWRVMNGGFTHVIAFLSTPSFYAALARAAGVVPALISSERFSFQLGFPDRWRKFELQAHRMADAVVCNSEHHAIELAESCRWLRVKTRIVYNGVLLPPVERDRHWPEAGTGPSKLLVLSTVAAHKNFAALIEALGLLKARKLNPPVVLWAGKGPKTPADRQAYALAGERIATLGLEQNWQWLGERSDVPQLLAGCDALIHPSRAEGFPNAIGEALAAARPVLASAIGDHPRLIREGENGFLFDPETPESIASTIERFGKTDPATRRQMSCNARATAGQSLGIGTMVGGFAGILAQLEPPII